MNPLGRAPGLIATEALELAARHRGGACAKIKGVPELGAPASLAGRMALTLRQEVCALLHEFLPPRGSEVAIALAPSKQTHLQSMASKKLWRSRQDSNL